MDRTTDPDYLKDTVASPSALEADSTAQRFLDELYCPSTQDAPVSSKNFDRDTNSTLPSLEITDSTARGLDKGAEARGMMQSAFVDLVKLGIDPSMVVRDSLPLVPKLVEAIMDLPNDPSKMQDFMEQAQQLAFKYVDPIDEDLRRDWKNLTPDQRKAEVLERLKLAGDVAAIICGVAAGAAAGYFTAGTIAASVCFGLISGTGTAAVVGGYFDSRANDKVNKMNAYHMFDNDEPPSLTEVLSGSPDKK